MVCKQAQGRLQVSVMVRIQRRGAIFLTDTETAGTGY